MMARQDMDTMLLFADRWWWFPGARISEESEFEWKDNRAYLLQVDGSAIEGIAFAGEVSPDPGSAQY